jgi:hypothetical protein
VYFGRYIPTFLRNHRLCLHIQQFSVTLVPIYQTTQGHILEDRSLNTVVRTSLQLVLLGQLNQVVFSQNGADKKRVNSFVGKHFEEWLL